MSILEVLEKGFEIGLEVLKGGTTVTEGMQKVYEDLKEKEEKEG